MEKASLEVQQDTPLGAYAAEYITYVSQPQRSYYEINVQIGYRRSEEQIQTIVNATSFSALNDLLEAALDGGRTELVVRIGYWQTDGRDKVAQTVDALRQARGIPEETVWIVRYYPQSDPVGIIEFLLKPSEDEIAAYQEEQAAAAPDDEEVSALPEDSPAGQPLP